MRWRNVIAEAMCSGPVRCELDVWFVRWARSWPNCSTRRKSWGAICGVNPLGLSVHERSSGMNDRRHMTCLPWSTCGLGGLERATQNGRSEQLVEADLPHCSSRCAARPMTPVSESWRRVSSPTCSQCLDSPSRDAACEFQVYGSSEKLSRTTRTPGSVSLIEPAGSGWACRTIRPRGRRGTCGGEATSVVRGRVGGRGQEMREGIGPQDGHASDRQRSAAEPRPGCADEAEDRVDGYCGRRGVEGEPNNLDLAGHASTSLVRSRPFT